MRPYYDLEESGRKMREIRRAKHLSVKQVMEYMGFESVQAVYKWEKGKCFPQADNLLALAELYNVNPCELIVREDLDGSSFHLQKIMILNQWFVYVQKRILYTCS